VWLRIKYKKKKKKQQKLMNEVQKKKQSKTEKNYGVCFYAERNGMYTGKKKCEE